MSDENIKREQLIQFLQDNHKIIMWIMLAVVIYLSLNIRYANLNNLKDISNDKYIAADLDAFLFYRYGEYILEHGTHLVNDAMRFYPYGEPWDMLIYHQGFPYFLAYLYKFVHLFNNSVTYDFIYVIYPAITLGLTLLVFFLLVQSVFGTFTGLIATAALGFSPSYLFRTMVGVADHDAIGMFMLILSIYFYILALKQENKWFSVLFGFITGISTIFMVAVWPGSGNFLYLILGG